MPLLLAILGGAVSSQVITAVVIRLAVAIGISVLSYAGIGVLFSSIFTNANSSMGGLASSTLTFLTMCSVPQGLNVIASAYTTALTLKGLSGAGVLKKISWGGAGSVLSP